MSNPLLIKMIKQQQQQQETAATTCWWWEDSTKQQQQYSNIHLIEQQPQQRINNILLSSSNINTSNQKQQQQQQQQQQQLLFQSSSDSRILSTSNSNGNNINDNNYIPQYIPQEIIPSFIVTASSSISSKMNLYIIIIVMIPIIIFCTTIYLWRKRNTTYQRLVNAGLPTVFWIPKFCNYIDSDTNTDTEEQTKKHHEQLSSKSITNILKRMEQYNGPYDMYGTVYGLSTPVIHIAHPIPALAILSLSVTSSASTQKLKSKSTIPTSSKLSNTISNSAAVTKQPAYNHFKNFCGNGVFTADGYDWKMKRIAVTHALLRPPSLIPITTNTATTTATTASSCTNLDKNSNTHVQNTNTNTKQLVGQGGIGGYQLKTEQEANYAATKLLLELQRKTNTVTTQTIVDTNDSCHNNNTDKVPNKNNAFNIVPILQNTTIGIIYRYITHTDLPSTSTSTCTSDNNNNNNNNSNNSNNNENGTTQKYTTSTNHKQAQTTTLVSLYLQSIIRIRMIILAQSRSIWFLLPRWMYHMFSSMYRQEEITMIPIRQLAHQACIDATTSHTNATSPLAQLQNNYKDLYNNITTTTKENILQPKKFSKNLIDEAITLLFAGQDTTAATLSWTIHLLCIYPEIQIKLANEIRQVFSNENQNNNNDNTSTNNCNSNNNNVYVTKQMISKMTYLDAVIKESMRLYPVAPFVVRKLTNPIHLPPDNDSTTSTNNGTTTKEIILPSESMACIWIYSLHRNKKFWNNPDAFIPERWLRQQSNNNTVSTSTSTSASAATVEDVGIRNGAYMPFAAGPRNCIGQPLAQIILRVLLSQLINRYEFRDPRLVLICNNDNSKNNNNCSINSRNDNKCSSVGANSDYCIMNDLPSIDDRLKLRIDMQAGFTVLPKGGVSVTFHERC